MPISTETDVPNERMGTRTGHERGRSATRAAPWAAPLPAGEVVIVANRLPVRRAKRAPVDVWESSPGGLVSAMRPILRSRPSTWVGWPGFTGDVPLPFHHEGIHNCPVSMSREELHEFYEGFSNSSLWPLYHDAVRPAQYHRSWWRSYVEVNRRFAEAAAETAARNATVWVHDYQLQLVPSLLRSHRPDVRIGFFLHIPFPPHELFAQIPWRRPLLEGLLGADLIGFQTRDGAVNFAESCGRFTTASGCGDLLSFQGRSVRVQAFPISIDVARIEEVAGAPKVLQAAENFRRRLSGRRKILLGVDRLDYTKGIDLRLRAFQELLRSGRSGPEACVFVQVAVPSREHVDEYRELRGQVERQVGQINGEYGQLGLVPVHYLHRSFPLEKLVALYRAADVMLVTPFRDGMNLVAKEYVASRLDDLGALVLSEFTGAAAELSSALLVNPHDIDGVVTAMEQALNLSDGEQRRRMGSMRKVIREHDVFRWAESFFGSLRT